MTYVQQYLEDRVRNAEQKAVQHAMVADNLANRLATAVNEIRKTNPELAAELSGIPMDPPAKVAEEPAP